MFVTLFNTFPNENGSFDLNLEYSILIDDTLETIYKKILYSYNEHYYKYLKLELKIYADNQLISNDIILTDKSLYSYISSDILMNNPPLRFEIYLTNISDVINQNKDGFFINALYLDFQSNFEKYYEEYPYLTLDIIKYLTYFIFQDDIKMTLDADELILQYQDEEDKAIDLSKNAFATDELSFYRELQQGIKVIPILDSINLTYKPKENMDYYIKLLSIYNYLELSDTIPFIGISKKFMKNTGDYTKDPLVRIYNKTNASAKEIQNWMMTKRNNILYYKKITGLMIKYKIDNNLNYLSISISSNNIIKVEWNDIQSNKNIDLSYTNCIYLIKKYINNFITILNNLPKITLQKQKIPLIDNNYNLYITSIDTKTEVPVYIEKSAFLNIINKSWIQRRFELKNTKSIDTIYLLYVHENLSISFKDNLYNKGSVIMIYNAKNFFQINLIINELLAIYNTINPEIRKKFEDLQTIIKKSTIKDLRSAGAEITSRKCQGNRQPKIYDDTIPIKTYTLEYNGISYMCNENEYPYPGVQNMTGNEICCFKADQRTKPHFIKKIYPDLLNTIVQPSNFKVNIEQNNKTITTFVIKVIYSMNNDIKYNWLSDDNKLHPITNENLIKKIESLPYNIWLEPTELYNIINLPQKTKCNTPPDIYNKNNDNINQSCQKYTDTPFFSYNNKFSVPCCVNTTPIERVDEKKKSMNPFSHAKIKTERILSYNRLGELYPGLSVLFNTYFIKGNDRFYRIGVNQGTYSFLNTLLKALNIQNALDIINAIKDYLIENLSLFKELKGGEIFLKFKTVPRYIAYITKKIEIDDIIDILQIMYKINIHIFDIPLKTTEFSKEYLYDKMKLLCKFKKYENYNRNILLLKKSEYYENLVLTNKNDEITYIFDNNEKCIQFLDIYYQKSCKVIEKYPEDYKYTKLLHVSEVTDVTVAVKYVNNINISFVLINDILFPIQEISIDDIKVLIPNIQVSELSNNMLVPIEQYISKMNIVNAKLKQPFTLLGYTVKKNKDMVIKMSFDSIFKNKPTIKEKVMELILKGNADKVIQILNKLQMSIPNFPIANDTVLKQIANELISKKTVDDLTTNYINNVLTSYNINVPLQDSKESLMQNALADKVPRLDYQTTPLEDIYLPSDSMDRVDANIINDNKMIKYNKTIRHHYYNVFQAKPLIKEQLDKIILDKLTFQDKFIKIKKYLEKLQKNIPNFPVTNDIILSEIARQIIDDKTVDYLVMEKIKENDNETILLSMDDIFTWISDFK
jgi:hypothetical protein